MKRPTALLLALALGLPGQEARPGPAKPDRDQLMGDLMNAVDARSLTSAIQAAKAAGLPSQMLLEARFVFLVNENNIPGLAALAPELEKQLPSFSPDNTLIFAVKEDFESIVHYTRALDALLKKDQALFKKHITEAFWLGPDHASQFAPHIKQLRMQEAMKNLVLDLNRPFENQKNPDRSTSLSTLMGEAPACLVHFWSPWVQQSILTLPEFEPIARILIKQGIPVTSFLLGGSAGSRKDGDAFLAGEGKNLAGTWLVDPPKDSLASRLRVSAFPTVVLIDKTGRILFNGDPADPALWDRLAKINPAIKPPTADLVLPDESSGGRKNE